MSTGSYQEDGYVILEDAFSPDAVSKILADAVRICRGHYGEYSGLLGSHDGESDDEVLGHYHCIHHAQIGLEVALGHGLVLDVLCKQIQGGGKAPVRPQTRGNIQRLLEGVPRHVGFGEIQH